MPGRVKDSGQHGWPFGTTTPSRRPGPVSRGLRPVTGGRRAVRPASQGTHEYRCGVVPTSYDAFFSACATVAGALIGLLFVAISISPAKLSGPRAENDHQLKAAMAFSALVNTMVIALVSLLPGASLGLTVIILAAGGLSSTAGLIILLLRDTRLRVRVEQLILPAVLLALYSLQLAGGIQMGGPSPDRGHLGNLGGLCIGFFGFAIARAWALVGARDSSLLAAVVQMARGASNPDGKPAVPGGEAGEAAAPGRENAG
jgi:hypothetical protein